MAQTNGTNNSEVDEKVQQQNDGVGRPITRTNRESGSNTPADSRSGAAENQDDESNQV